MKKVIKTIAKIIIIFFAIYILVSNILQTINGQTLSFFGIKSFIVLSGSMEPTINVGDLIFVKDTKNIKEQDIISFQVENAVITHRVIEITKNNTYITKGDANNIEDTEEIAKDKIQGKYFFKIGKIGNIILFFKTNYGMLILIMLFLLYLLIVNRKNIRKDKCAETKKTRTNRKIKFEGKKGKHLK